MRNACLTDSLEDAPDDPAAAGGKALSPGRLLRAGLPAVVNVKDGTRMIRTGQTITVDGSQGLVVLEGGPETGEAPARNA